MQWLHHALHTHRVNFPVQNGFSICYDKHNLILYLYTASEWRALYQCLIISALKSHLTVINS